MSTLKCVNISKQDGSASVPTDTVVNGSSKAWVNFDGTATPLAIRASFNVLSLTDRGVGQYSVNFLNAFTDANYVFHGSASYVASGGDSPGPRIVGPFTNTVAQFDIYGAGAVVDSSQVHLSVLR